MKDTRTVKPHVLFVINGGCGTVGSINPPATVDCDVLDYDDLRDAIKHKNPISLSQSALSYIREHDADDADFVAAVENLLFFKCSACGRSEDDCSINPCPAVIAAREATV